MLLLAVITPHGACLLLLAVTTPFSSLFRLFAPARFIKYDSCPILMMMIVTVILGNCNCSCSHSSSTSTRGNVAAEALEDKPEASPFPARLRMAVH